MRAAQAALSGEDLRQLGRQRQQLIAGLAHEARRVSADAGHPVSDAVGREIESTFEAALADVPPMQLAGLVAFLDSGEEVPAAAVVRLASSERIVAS